MQLQVVRDKAPSEPTLLEKIDKITKDCSKPYFGNSLKRLAMESPANAETIYDYIYAEIAQANIKPSTKETKIKVLVWLSRKLGNKPFKEMTKEDIYHTLRTLEDRKKSQKNYNPLDDSWVGTYNGRQIILFKFFKWLYNPAEPNPEQRETLYGGLMVLATTAIDSDRAYGPLFSLSPSLSDKYS